MIPAAPPADGRQSQTALAVARGVRRYLRALGFATLTELPLPDGRRADIVALRQDGALHIVEIKSSAADFRADTKWQDYRAHCDQLFFAIPQSLSPLIMPLDAGLIIADAYGADLLHGAPEHRLAPATRRSLLIRFAGAAAHRLHLLHDPEWGS